MRSLASNEKLGQIINLINEHEIDLAVLTETWLKHDVAHSLANVAVAQSEHHPSRGVLILGKGTIRAFQPLLPAIWSPNLIVVKAQFTKTLAPLAVIGHYSSNTCQAKLDE